MVLKHVYQSLSFNKDGLRQHFIKEETVKFLQAN